MRRAPIAPADPGSTDRFDADAFTRLLTRFREELYAMATLSPAAEKEIARLAGRRARPPAPRALPASRPLSAVLLRMPAPDSSRSRRGCSSARLGG